MFIGHYSVGFAAKSVEKSLPLWLLFIAVQFIDILWASFVLLDVEKLRIVPGFTASNPLDLYYMPYTHSLVGALAWTALVFVACRSVRVKGWANAMRVALILGAAVFSHWALDFIVHIPDLPLYGDTMKVGLGLWNLAIPALALEVGILFASIWLYLRSTSADSAAGKYGVAVMGLIMFVIQVVLSFGPPPSSAHAAARTALVLYALFAVTIAWLEKKRSPLVDAAPAAAASQA
jgi:hypothetical protein